MEVLSRQLDLYPVTGKKKKKKKDLRVVSPRVVDENMDMDNKKHGDNIKIISGLKNVK